MTYSALSPKVYDQFENIFMLLIHNTKNKDEIGGLTKIKSAKVIELFKETFGQKPNLKNLRKFFLHDIIQQLWWGQNGFRHSAELREIVSDLNPQEL